MKKLLMFLVIIYLSQQQTVINFNQSFIIYNQSSNFTHYLNYTFDSNNICQPFMSCTYNNPLYTINEHSNNNNSYSLIVSNPLSQNILFSISSTYQVTNPIFNTLTCNNSICNCATTSCIMNIQSNCKQSKLFSLIDQINIVVSIPNQPNVTLSYDIKCQGQYNSNVLSYGMIIALFVGIVLMLVAAAHSEAKSIGNRGIIINIYVIVIFNLIIILNGLLILFANISVSIWTNDIGGGLVTILSISLCTNEVLFMIKGPHRHKFNIKRVDLRLMDIISLLVGCGVVLGWYFTSKNWLINDIGAICNIFAIIKFMKFTSFKMIILCFGTTIVIIIIINELIYQYSSTTFNMLLINTLNIPFSLQVPSISALYKQRCAWVGIMTLSLHGVNLSFLRRFDLSRNSTIYFLIGAISFIGSLVIEVIMFIVIPYQQLPSGLLAAPLPIIVVLIVSNRRNEVRTLWDGKFFDEIFAHKDHNIGIEMRLSYKATDLSQYSDLVKNLKVSPSINQSNSIYSQGFNFDSLSRSSDINLMRVMKELVGDKVSSNSNNDSSHHQSRNSL